MSRADFDLEFSFEFGVLDFLVFYTLEKLNFNVFLKNLRFENTSLQDTGHNTEKFYLNLEANIVNF